MRTQLRHQVRLDLEHPPDIRVHVLAQHDLDRDLAARVVLFVQEDVSEPARAQDAHEREAGELRRL